MAAPSAEEIGVLVELDSGEQFRKRVQDVLETKEQEHDSYLLRWLRARDLDLNKSEKMLRASLMWRKENNVDNALSTPLDSFFTTEFPYAVITTDKFGQPVVFVPIGKWDARKVVDAGREEDFRTFSTYYFESLLEDLRKRNMKRGPDQYPLTQFTYVADWKGFSYMQLINPKAIQTLFQMASIYEAHYPEILFKAISINCPSFIGVLLAMLKTILAPKTLGKLVCIGSDPETWKKTLAEVLDDDQIKIVLNSRIK